MKCVNTNAESMKVLVTVSKVGMKINADVNAKN